MSHYQGAIDIIEREAVNLEQKLGLAKFLKELGSLEDAHAVAQRNLDAKMAEVAKAESTLTETNQAIADAKAQHASAQAAMQEEHAKVVDEHQSKVAQLIEAGYAKAHAVYEETKAKLEAQLDGTRQKLAEALSHLGDVQSQIEAHTTALTEITQTRADAEAALKAVQDHIHTLAVHAG